MSTLAIGDKFPAAVFDGSAREQFGGSLRFYERKNDAQREAPGS